MTTICPHCGNEAVEKRITNKQPENGTASAICPACDSTYPFSYLPLLSLGGAPGAGKTTTARQLAGTVPVVVLESDLVGDIVEMEWTAYCEAWLRICAYIHQSGRPALLAGSGIEHPEKVADSPETHYFPTIERCVLVCDDDVLAERLRERPRWRENPDWVEAHVELNQWFRDHGPNHGLTVVDTTDRSIEEVVTIVRRWVEETLTGVPS